MSDSDRRRLDDHKESAAWQRLVNDCRVLRRKEVRVRWPCVPLGAWIFNACTHRTSRTSSSTTTTMAQCRYRLVVVARGGPCPRRRSTAPPPAGDVTGQTSSRISPRSVRLFPSLQPRLLVCSRWWMIATFVKSSRVPALGAWYNTTGPAAAAVLRDNGRTTHRPVSLPSVTQRLVFWQDAP